MYFVKRKIVVVFTGPSSVTLTDHRVTARITSVGDPNIGSAQLQIFGMTLDKMNQLSTFGRAFMTPNYNYQVTIIAGDEVNGMNKVFQGTIQQAWGDYQDMPNVPFHVLAFAAPTVQTDVGGQNYNSYEGPTDVTKMFSNLAGKMGFQFEDGGLKAKLNSPYHFGSPFRQAQLIKEAADCNLVYENGVMAVWPRDKARSGDNLQISKETGMVTEPSFTDYGVLVRAEFTKPVKYGTNMEIKSIITPANGLWSIKQIDYDLAAEFPNGPWFVTPWGAKPDQVVPYVPKF